MPQLSISKPPQPCQPVASHSAQVSRKVKINTKKVIGDYLDEYLVGTNKPNIWVWIPKADVINKLGDCLTLRLYQNQPYSAAELQIANAIRLYLTNHQMINGKDILL